MTKQVLSLTLALCGALTFALPSQAEDTKPGGGPGGRRGPGGPGGHRMDPEERLKQMKETLNLTDDQVAKIKPILEKGASEAKAIHEDASVQGEDKRSKTMEVMKSTREQVNEILTPEQREKAKAEREKRGGPGGKRGPKPQ